MKRWKMEGKRWKGKDGREKMGGTRGRNMCNSKSKFEYKTVNGRGRA